MFNFLGEADKEFQAIIALIHEVEGFAKQYNVPGANINPYTNLTGAVSFVYSICLHFLIKRLKQKSQKNLDFFYESDFEFGPDPICCIPKCSITPPEI